MNYTLADLLQLLGAKEMELFILRRQIAELEAALKASQPPEVH